MQLLDLGELPEPDPDRVLALPDGSVVILDRDLDSYEETARPGDDLLAALGIDPESVHRPPLALEFGPDGVLKPPRRHDGSNEREGGR